MRWLIDFLRSSIGAKVLMGITGIGLVLFTIAHMLANLQMYLGPAPMNAYGHGLRQMPGLLWTMRGLLLAAVLVHIGAAMMLTVQNRRARPERYRYNRYRAAGYSSRTMAMSGILIFAFVAYHLAHYTFLWVNPEYANLVDDLGRHDVYSMTILGFSNYAVSAAYIIAVGLLCMHLSHGIPSFFQSLGLRHPKYTPIVEVVGPAVAIVLFLGFAAVPIGVMAKWLTLAGGA